MNYVFDVETALLNDNAVDVEFAAWLLTWSISNSACFVTVDEYETTVNSLGIDLTTAANHVYDLTNNAVWVKGQLKDQAKFEMSDSMQRILDRITSVSPFAVKTGEHTIVHPSYCTFSVVGGNATDEQRYQYSEYDGNVAERRRIIGQIHNCFPSYRAKLSGDVAIDIYPEGNDLDQHFAALKPFVYFGDRVYLGDPKYNVAKFADVHHVTSSWQETFSVLQRTYNEEIK